MSISTDNNGNHTNPATKNLFLKLLAKADLSYQAGMDLKALVDHSHLEEVFEVAQTLVLHLSLNPGQQLPQRLAGYSVELDGGKKVRLNIPTKDQRQEREAEELKKKLSGFEERLKKADDETEKRHQRELHEARNTIHLSIPQAIGVGVVVGLAYVGVRAIILGATGQITSTDTPKPSEA